MDERGIHYSIRFDTDRLMADANRSRKAFEAIGKEAAKQGQEIDDAFAGQKLQAAVQKLLADIGRLGGEAFAGLTDNARRMAREMQEGARALSEVERLMSALGTAYAAGTVGQEEFAQASARLAVLHERVAEDVRAASSALEDEVRKAGLAEDSIERMGDSLSRLSAEYARLSAAQRGGAEGEGILRQMSELRSRLDEAEAAMGRFGMAGRSQFNMLGMSVQQIVRELPSLAMGPQMFFLAISNNLPVFTDELARARKEYELLSKSGKAAIPVWKQVASSLLSWQTLLVAGVSLLTLHGDKIAKWAKGLFSAESATRKMADAQKALNKASLEGAKNAQEEATRLRLLYRAAQDASLPVEKRKAAIDELQRAYPEYFANLSDEEMLAGKASDAYDRLTRSIVAAARARAAQDAIVEQQKAVLENEQKIAEAYSRRGAVEQRLEEFRQREQAAPSRPYGDAGLTIKRKDIEEELKAIDEEIAGYRSAIFNANRLSKELEGSIDVGDLIDDTGGGKGGGGGNTDDRMKNAEDAARQLLALRRRNQEAEIALMEEGREKKLAQIRLDYEEEMDEIARLEREWAEKQGGTVTVEQRVELSQRRVVAAETRDKAVADLGKEEERREKERLQRLLEDYQDYAAKRKAAEAKFAADRKALEAAGAGGGRLGELDHQREEALAAIDHEFASREEAFSAWADGVIGLSLGKLRELLEAAYQEMTTMEIADPGNANLATARAKVGRLREAISQKELEEEVSPGKATKDWDKLYDVLSEVEEVFGEIGDTVGGTLGEIISLAGESAAGAMQLAGAVKGVGEAAGGLEKASAILAAISAGMKLVSGFAGFFKGLFGADYSAYESMKEQYDTLIGVWDELIGKKMEYIDIDYGAEAAKAADEAARLTQTNILRNRQLAQQLMRSGSGWFSHSLGVRISDRMSASDWSRLSGLVGQHVGSMADVLNLDASVIGKTLEDERFVSVLTEVNAEFIDYIGNISDYGDQLEEIAEKEKEVFTGVSFDEFRDSFVSTLQDMDASAQDLADNVETYLRNAILQTLVTEQYAGRIRGLYDLYAGLSDSDGDGQRDLTASEADTVRGETQKLAEEIMDARDNLMEAFGFSAGEESATPAQQASSAVSVQASQESIDEANGRMLAIQEGERQILDAVVRQAGKIDIGNVNLDAIRRSSAESRDIIESCYVVLGEIRDNTGAVVEPIRRIDTGIQELKTIMKEGLL